MREEVFRTAIWPPPLMSTASSDTPDGADHRDALGRTNCRRDTDDLIE